MHFATIVAVEKRKEKEMMMMSRRVELERKMRRTHMKALESS